MTPDTPAAAEEQEALKERNEALVREEFAAQKTVLRCRPMFLQIETTSHCNGRCVICERTHNRFEPRRLDPAVLDTLEREVFPTLRDTSIQGFGEPLVDPRFDEVLDRMTAHGVHTGFTTNAALLTADRLEKYVRLGVFLTVSIDGASREVFRRIRPCLDFDHIVDVLSLTPALKARYPESGFHLRIHFVGTTANIDDLPAMIDLAERLDADDIEVLNLLTRNLPPEVSRTELARDPGRANRRFREARARAEGSPVELRLPPMFGEEGTPAAFDPSEARNYLLWEKLPCSRSPYPNSCSDPWTRFIVSATGDVLPCCVWPYSLGNLTRQSFEEIWNGSGFRKTRRRVNSRYPQTPCKECTLWSGINAGRREAVAASLPLDCRLHTSAQRLAAAFRR